MIITISSPGRYHKAERQIAVNCSRAGEWGNPYVGDSSDSPANLTQVAALYAGAWLSSNPTLVAALWERIDRRRYKAGLSRYGDWTVLLACGSNHRPCHCEVLAVALRDYLREAIPDMPVTLRWDSPSAGYAGQVVDSAVAGLPGG